MGYWTTITGIIEVSPMGRTQPEKRYILDTVLEHLPEVPGMETHVVQEDGYDGFCTHNEFQEPVGGTHREKYSRVQNRYLISIKQKTKDLTFDQNKKRFLNWMTRLSKRVGVYEVAVKIHNCFTGESFVISDPEPFYRMREGCSWTRERDEEVPEINWCEYLMWDRSKDCIYPLALMCKYYESEEDDVEFERRAKFERGE